MAIPAWIWIALPTVFTIAAVASVDADETQPILVPKGAAGVDQAWAALGYSPAWQQWGRWVAWGESRWHITAQLGKPSDPRPMAENERAAAWKGYERLAARGDWPCPALTKSKAPGSGGYYGQLFPLTTYFLWRRYGNLFSQLYCDPVAAWRNPRVSTLAHIGQLRGTIAIAKRKLGRLPTRLELRALYGVPSRDPNEVDTEHRRALYTSSAAKAGLPAGWLDVMIDPLPPPNLGLEAAAPTIESAEELDAVIAEAIGLQYTGGAEEPAAS